jgi:hypothetical protein
MVSYFQNNGVSYMFPVDADEGDVSDAGADLAQATLGDHLVFHSIDGAYPMFKDGVQLGWEDADDSFGAWV